MFWRPRVFEKNKASVWWICAIKRTATNMRIATFIATFDLILINSTLDRLISTGGFWWMTQWFIRAPAGSQCLISLHINYEPKINVKRSQLCFTIKNQPRDPPSSSRQIKTCTTLNWTFYFIESVKNGSFTVLTLWLNQMLGSSIII